MRSSLAGAQTPHVVIPCGHAVSTLFLMPMRAALYRAVGGGAKRGDGSPISTQLPHARPGRCAADPGRGRLHRVRRDPAGGAGATRPDALSGRVACECRGEPPRRPPRVTSVQRDNSQ